ncbi:hypothetical protein ATCC90586_000572 [Pythium insidiosum]|nr:hypothetical protein ATCC90586_000572 [Pythium insidiosum]
MDMSAPLRNTAAASPPATITAADTKQDAPEIPVQLSLGDFELTMDASGQWEMAHSQLQDYIDQVKELSQRNEELERANRDLRAKCQRLTEESNMEKFKCQLLVEMLALSSLDEERSRGEAEQERSKVASLKSDVLALLEQARKEGVDIRRIAAALPVP